MKMLHLCYKYCKHILSNGILLVRYGMEGMNTNEKAKSRYFANKFDYYDYSNNYISGDSNF